MIIEQIYTGCLAQGAYYITSEGEAAIIDPLRETKPYSERLNRDNVQLKYIFETHFHADFVSGHLDLSKATRAPIVFGPNANPEFDFISAKDNQEFNIGSVTIKVIHTPGHTMESTCYLLIDKNGKNHAIFTGDTLFIGDVGRPDLTALDGILTKEKLAATLYHSLRNKIMILEDDVIIYPAHGAGSACGKNMSKETISTLGEQKKSNYALRADMTESDFIKEVTDGLLDPPAYFGMNAQMNKSIINKFDVVLASGLKAIPVSQFENVCKNTNALILDSRNSGDFAQGFIPNSINIGISGDFAPWVGALIANVRQPIILVTEPGKEEETVTRLSRVGFDNQIGHLQGGFQSWKNSGHEIATINRITAQEFENKLNIETDTIIDIRRNTEFETAHVENAINKPLATINDWIETINPSQHFFIHCAGGYRSMVAGSILHSRGYFNFSEIEGGYNSITKTNIK
jgi:hydroxyacylglutathione hydrolase